MKRALYITARNGEAQRRSRFPGEELPPDLLQHLEKSLRKQWKRYCKELKRCQRDFSEKAVHESRVETRRLLAVIELLAGFFPAARVKKVRRALKQHLDTFDDLRDTQVQLAGIGKLRSESPAARAFHAWLADRERRLTKETRGRVKRIQTGRLGKLIRASRNEVEEAREKGRPEKAAARLFESVSQAFERTAKLRAMIDSRDTASIHCTRVAFKRFRYMLEALACYFPVERTELLARLRQYQTMMGDIQDAEVLVRSYDKFLCEASVEPRLARQFREALLRRRQGLIQEFLPAADQLHEFWPRAWLQTGSLRPGKAVGVKTKRRASASSEQRKGGHQ